MIPHLLARRGTPKASLWHHIHLSSTARNSCLPCLSAFLRVAAKWQKIKQENIQQHKSVILLKPMNKKQTNWIPCKTKHTVNAVPQFSEGKRRAYSFLLSSTPWGACPPSERVLFSLWRLRSSSLLPILFFLPGSKGAIYLLKKLSSSSCCRGLTTAERPWWQLGPGGQWRASVS